MLNNKNCRTWQCLSCDVWRITSH